jgi:hypothetical protein
MEDVLNKTAYSQQALEIVAVANEYCKFLEQAKQFSKQEFIGKSLRFLPYLYLKASMVPAIADDLVFEAEKFVMENDWLYIRNKVASILGSHDLQILLNDPNNQLSDDVPEVELSECFADIYQDLKDLSMAYQMANDQTICDSLWDFRKNFSTYWGIRLLYLQVALHQIFYSDDNLDDESATKVPKAKNTDNWIISQRMQQFRNDTELDDEDILN